MDGMGWDGLLAWSVCWWMMMSPDYIIIDSARPQPPPPTKRRDATGCSFVGSFSNVSIAVVHEGCNWRKMYVYVYRAAIFEIENATGLIVKSGWVDERA